MTTETALEEKLAVGKTINLKPRTSRHEKVTEQ
jgi:hypothetical protein